MSVIESIEKVWGKPENLHPDLEPYLTEGPLGWMIHHPLSIQLFYNPIMNAMINRGYEAKLEAVAAASAARRWEQYIFLHERPYRLDALEIIEDDVTDQVWWQLVRKVWIDSESIPQEQERWDAILRSDRPGKQFIMAPADRAVLRLLAPEFVIWQGHTVDRHDGWSWTINRGIATRFANMFATREDSKPVVTKARARRADVLALFTQRGEDEILIDPNKVIHNRSKA